MNNASQHNNILQKMKKGLKSVIVLMVMLTISCTQSQVQEQSEETELIELTEEQFTTNAMELAPMSVVVMDSVVECNGQLIPARGGEVQLGIPLSGIVKSVYVQEGQKVEKGQLLAEIGGNEMIEIQRELAVSATENEQLQSEYARIKLLYEGQAVSEKEYKASMSAGKTALARYKSLKMRVQELGLPVSRVESGEFFGAYPVVATLSGQLSGFDLKPGSRVETSTPIAGIVNPGMLQLKLSVYESDAEKVKSGQEVQFRLPSGTKVHSARVSRIAAVLTEPARILEVYADITSSGVLLANQVVSCNLIVKSDSVNALPLDAIAKTETGKKVLVVEKKVNGSYYFNPTEVITGRQRNGYVEITSPFMKGEILVKGIYTIQLN